MDGCKPSSGIIDIETIEHIVTDILMSNRVDYLVKKCTCTFDVTPLPAQVQIVSSFGAIHLWILLLGNLFKNKIISYIFAMLVMSMTVLSKLNTRILYIIGCPMYMVSGAIQRLTMNRVTSCNTDLK